MFVSNQWKLFYIKPVLKHLEDTQCYTLIFRFFPRFLFEMCNRGNIQFNKSVNLICSRFCFLERIHIFFYFSHFSQNFVPFQILYYLYKYIYIYDKITGISGNFGRICLFFRIRIFPRTLKNCPNKH